MYTLFQNDIPIDVECHRYTMNMQVSSGTKNNSSPNKPSCKTVTVSFNGVLLLRTEEAIRALGHHLGGKSLHDDNEINYEVEMWFLQQAATFYDCNI
ncbi:uncharacterized protein TNCV_118401 [Trichonephila clavipes]|nr:uncharacterized protein TNCV_118401 [Trichonephila clavipes]